ncbi:MAG: hypothetical protein HZB34_12375 [Nitrospirae bacterium]|nr:hypothetical protein [Nitrospirota bacterium]
MYGASKTLLVCWILLSSPLWSYGNTPTPVVPTDKPNQHNSNTQEKPAPDQRGTEEAPLVIKLLPAPNDEKPANYNAKNKISESADWWWDHIPEILLALFTLCLFIATYLLYRATKKLVMGAEDTAKRQLRAYISITGGELVERNEGSNIIGFQVHFKNAGQTPAYDVLSGAQCTIMDLPRNAPLPLVPLTEKSKSTFGPGIDSSLFPTMKIPTSEQKTAIDNRKAAIYIHGRIEYRDAFDRGQTTNFNLIYRMTNTGRYIIGNDKDGNDAT